ncbi:MAG TPA: isochorismatase family protein [Blastocatellia bacterium]|nr:isochorismatase family protein [Blastocatellia bacterium]
MLDRKRAALVVIDMQEKFRPIMADFDEIAQRIAIMVQGCTLLNVPIIVTEQYPQGLGCTAPEIKAHLPETIKPIEKLTFSGCGVPEFDLQLREQHVEQLMLVGIEAHICVSQTAHDLLQLGYQVHLIEEAIGARSAHNRAVAFAKMQRAGAILSSVEMSLFEMMEASDAAEFKAVQKLIK